MATVEQALAATLRTLREQKGYSQTDVANCLNVKQPTIANWENGLRTPSPTYLSCLSQAYETTPSEVYAISESNEMQQQAKQLERNINEKRKGTWQPPQKPKIPKEVEQKIRKSM